MKWEKLLPDIRRHAPGVPDFIAEEAIRESAIRFCQKTDVYKREERVTLSPNVDSYRLSVPNAYEVNHVIDVFNANGRRLDAVSYERLREVQERLQPGVPRFYGGFDNVRVQFAPLPKEAYQYLVIFSVKPTDSATAIPDEIGLEHSDAIAHGALARLLAQPEEWRDLQLADYMARQARKETSRVARIVKYGYGGASLKVYAREFGT